MFMVVIPFRPNSTSISNCSIFILNKHALGRAFTLISNCSFFALNNLHKELAFGFISKCFTFALNTLAQGTRNFKKF